MFQIILSAASQAPYVNMWSKDWQYGRNGKTKYIYVCVCVFVAPCRLVPLRMTRVPYEPKHVLEKKVDMVTLPIAMKETNRNFCTGVRSSPHNTVRHYIWSYKRVQVDT